MLSELSAAAAVVMEKSTPSSFLTKSLTEEVLLANTTGSLLPRWPCLLAAANSKAEDWRRIAPADGSMPSPVGPPSKLVLLANSKAELCRLMARLRVTTVFDTEKLVSVGGSCRSLSAAVVFVLGVASWTEIRGSLPPQGVLALPPKDCSIMELMSDLRLVKDSVSNSRKSHQTLSTS